MKTILKILVLPFLLLIMGFIRNNNIQNFTQNLNEKEISSLIFMLEEEKLAFDVYSKMDEKWGRRQFGNIKNSEQTHMEVLQKILNENHIKYQLLEQGKFNNENLQILYNKLIEHGNQSEKEALKVGAKIEDVDIFDLIRLKKDTENEKIIKAYNFLECGSRNHLRAFTRGLNGLDETYKPEFISQKNYEKILNDEHEKCGQSFYE